MQRVINRKRYDTETATQVCDVSDGNYSRRDFKFDDTYLYRTKAGNWFIAGQGGPMSRWARSLGQGNGWSSGSGIRPLEPAEARELLEQHNHLGALEEYFSNDIEDA